MNTVRTSNARGRRHVVARMAPPAPRPRRQQPDDLDDLGDRSLFSSAHALECTGGGYTWS